MRENWHNWNVMLWLGNDEDLYRQAVRRTRHLDEGETLSPEEAEKIVRDLLPDGTPDMEGPDDLDLVDWQDLAADLSSL